ncbi:rhodanese-like domain-containing protein [Macrococcus epidermidis]|uniref:rhodanese-like domain-containing protein n=1 Tax=Macrococcus epidermidis TaxID=1902580 RepID=UPI001EF35364|nr:rhodanese-like domain-containing protein [Macrococcus epidermidis]MCG7419848.1 rhodanese-like domain-containing protein [Macrococcus epidermidis]
MTKTITLDAIQDAINTGTDAVILDVRELDEFVAGHIPEATHLPLSEIETQSVALAKDVEYIIICKKGGRAMKAGQHLEEKGYNVTVAEQGMDDWTGEVKIED